MRHNPCLRQPSESLSHARRCASHERATSSQPTVVYSSPPTADSLFACAERAAKRATKKVTKAAKEAFAAGFDTWMRRLRNVDIDGAAAEEEEEAGVADEHDIGSWMRRLRFDDGSEGAGGGGAAAGLVA